VICKRHRTNERDDETRARPSRRDANMYMSRGEEEEDDDDDEEEEKIASEIVIYH
jgi:hypothetical protein